MSLLLKHFCRRLRMLCPVVLLLVVPISLAASPVTAQASQARSLVVAKVDITQVSSIPNSHPFWASPENHIGALPGSTQLSQLTLILNRPAEREAALAQLIRDQQNPASPSYHHWLTPEQLGEQFGPSASDIATVTGWLQQAGLKVIGVSPGHTFLYFSGTAKTAGAAFGVELQSYTVGAEQRFAPSTDLQIPAALAPVVAGVHGLSTLNLHPHSSLRGAQTAKSKNGLTTLGNGTHVVVPGDFSIIYDISSINAGGNNGAGQNIAIIGRARVLGQDVSNFNYVTATNVPQPNVIIPTAQGGIDPGPAGSTMATTNNDQVEQTLDVTRAGSVAQGANLDLIVSCNPSAANPATCDTTGNASADGVDLALEYATSESPVVDQIITVSYGSCERGSTSSDASFYDNMFQSAASQGQSVFVSSGDSGAAGCVSAGSAISASSVTALSPNLLCSSSYATCLGGTSFSDAANPGLYWSSSNGAGLVSALGYIPEGAWNDGGCAVTSGITQCFTDASGGGVSGLIPAPSYQTGIGVPGTQGRYTPDIALLAGGDTSYLICIAGESTSQSDSSCTVNQSTGEFGFLEIGGTSAAAPSMAGITALLNVKTSSANGQLNPTLYSLAANPLNSVFHDVTVATSAVSNCTPTVVSACNNSLPGRTSTTVGVTQGYLVTNGYDEVTGLGSLDVANLLDHYQDAPLPVPVVSLQITPSTANLGTTNVALSASISNSSDTVAPTGTVIFYAQASGAATPTAISDALPVAASNSTSATVSTSYIPTIAGTLAITAVYSGDTVNATASSAPGTLTVAQGTSSTTATDNSGSSNLTSGQTFTINIAVSGSDSSIIPTGTVALTGTNFTFSPTTATLSSTGTASVTAKAGSTAGNASYTATYSGDNQYSGSSASSGTFTVGATTTSTTVSIGNAPATLAGNQTGSFTVTVSATSPAASTTHLVRPSATAPTPTGTVTFTTTGGTVTPASGTLVNGALAATVLPNGPGQVTITAVYGGDGNYSGSSSAPVTITAGPNLGFAFTLTSTSVTAGQTANVPGTLTVTGGFNIADAGGTAAITGSCTGLPKLAACGLPSLNANADGSYAVILPITTTPHTTAAVRRTAGLGSSFTGWLALALGLPGMLALAAIGRSRNRSQNWRTLIGLFVLLLIGSGLTACGGSSSGGNSIDTSTGTPAGTYTVSVTVNSAANPTTGYPALTSTGSLTLTVQ